MLRLEGGIHMPAKSILPGRVFILRMWEERSPPPYHAPVWRFSLEEPHTGERTGFKDLTELTRFLARYTAIPPPPDTPAAG
jgi:hypothetical protein